MLDKFRQLIASNKLEKAIDELISYLGDNHNDLLNQLTELKATLVKNTKDHRLGLISNGQEHRTIARVRFAVLEMLDEIDELSISIEPPAQSSPAGAKKSSGAPTVFISYNHGDSEVADELRQALEKNGIVIRIDHAVMQAGENIQEFIENSIRDTDVTLSIVSNRSLLSAWVALESIETFYREKFEKDKRFIACYIDDDFFQTDFHLKATEQIDAQIAEIDKLIPDYVAKGIELKDLNNQRSRLLKLRNNLGDILLRLKESLCLDIRGEKFNKSVTKLVSEIT